MPTVVLPVLDEAQALPWVLSRMPGGYIPLVVDNGSSEGSLDPQDLPAVAGPVLGRSADLMPGSAP